VLLGARTTAGKFWSGEGTRADLSDNFFQSLKRPRELIRRHPSTLGIVSDDAEYSHKEASPMVLEDVLNRQGDGRLLELRGRGLGFWGVCFQPETGVA